MIIDKRLAPQLSQVREAVKQFPGCTVQQLAALTLIPRSTFHRRLIELQRLGYIALREDDRYYVITTEDDDGMALRQCDDL